MEALVVLLSAMAVVTSVVLLLLIAERSARSNTGPREVQRLGQRAFATRSRALLTYEILTLAMLGVWVVPALWIDFRLPGFNMAYVLLMVLVMPLLVYAIVDLRFKNDDGDSLPALGETLERTIEIQYREGNLMDILVHIEGEAGRNPSIRREYESARIRLLLRDDEVGLAYREAIAETYGTRSSGRCV